MPLPPTEENKRKAFCLVLACTQIGAAKTDYNELLEKKVLVSVPLEMHDDYRAKLEACKSEVCLNEPFDWRVIELEPEITKDTTFEQLYQVWFRISVF